MKYCGYDESGCGDRDDDRERPFWYYGWKIFESGDTCIHSRM